MDELIASGEIFSNKKDSPFFKAKIDEIDSGGISISINGGLEKLKKKYSHIDTGVALSPGDTVLVLKMTGTYVILGRISN